MTAGGVSGTTWSHLKWAIPLIGIALFIILTISKQLTILNLGESLAKGLGQNVTMIRGICLIIAMILAGIAVAIAGQVAFVGLMVPHIARFLIGTDYAKILPLTALLGDTRACCRCDSTIFRRSACWRNHFIYRCSLLYI